MTTFVPPPPIPDKPKQQGFTPPPPVPDNPSLSDTGPAQLSAPRGDQAIGEPMRKVATGISTALDYQEQAVEKMLGGIEHVRHAIPGAEALHKPWGNIVHTGIPAVDSLGDKISAWSDQAAAQLEDTAIRGVIDPVTYETLGAGAAEKTAAGQALKTALKQSASKITRAPKIPWISDGKIGMQSAPDITQWGGDVAGERGAPFVQGLRGAGNVASQAGTRMQVHFENRARAILSKLPPHSVVKVGDALGTYHSVAELPPFAMEDAKSLNPVERSAFRQLRALTQLSDKFRNITANTIAVNNYAGDLSQADQQTLLKALNANKPIEVPKPEARIRQTNQAAIDLENRGRAINYPGSTPGERITVNAGPLEKATSGAKQVTLPPSKRFTFKPTNQAAIDHATMLQERYNTIAGVVEKEVKSRDAYMPGTHTGVDEGRPERDISPKNYFNPRNIQREELHITKPEQAHEGFGGMAASAGRDEKMRVLTEQLGSLLNDDKIDNLFKETIAATGNQRSDLQKFKDAWLKLIGYPRAAVVGVTPRHGANIMDLAMDTIPPQHFPQYVKDTMTLVTRLMAAASPEDYLKIIKEEDAGMGAVSGNFPERKAFFQKTPETTLGDLPFGQHLPPGAQGKKILGPLAGKSTGPIGAWMRLNNRLVWAIDDAAKITYAKILKEEGMKPLEAGGTASQRLVDYEHLSKLQKALKYVAPFGTFRGGIPGAVMGGIARNPARAAFLNRATGGTMYGGQPKQGQHGTELYNPTADVGRGLDNPLEFARGTLGAPVIAGATLGLEGIAKAAMHGEPSTSPEVIGQELRDLPRSLAHGQLPRPRKSKFADSVAMHVARYFNDGNPIDLHWLLLAAASGVPEARDVVQQLGQGQFKAKPAAQFLGNEAAMQVLGIGNK